MTKKSQEARSNAIKIAKCQTLCWDCKHATDIDVCPWVRDGTPVEGWWAKRKDIRYRLEACGTHDLQTRMQETYCVMMCPLFQRDSYRAGLTEMDEKNPSHVDISDATPLDLRRLSAAVITQAVMDWEKLGRGKLRKVVTAEGSTIKSFQLIDWFNSLDFAVMLSEVSNYTPEQIRKKLEVPNVSRG
jgi:hypothetical protein